MTQRATYRLPDDVTTPAERIPGIARSLGLSDHTEAHAIQLSERAFWVHPVNTSREGIAAAAVYAVGLRHNEKRSQAEIADAAGTTSNVISRVYREILAAEGIPTAANDLSRSGEASDDAGAARGLVARVKEVLFG